MKKIAFYCSGSASRIFKFYSLYSFNDYPAQFILYDGKDLGVFNKLKNISKKMKIYNLNLDYSFENNITFSNELLKLLVDYNIDYLICFGNRILKGNLLFHFKNKIINFHPSILPSFPGLNAIDQALKTSVQFLGNTAHFINEGVDSGPIIMQSAIKRSDYSCYEDVLVLQLEMLKKILILIDKNEIYIDDNEIVKINSDNKRNNKLPFFSY